MALPRLLHGFTSVSTSSCTCPASPRPCLQLHDVFVSFSGNLYLVFELLERDLKQAMDAVRHRGGLEEDLVRVYLYQLLTVSAREGRMPTLLAGQLSSCIARAALTEPN